MVLSFVLLVLLAAPLSAQCVGAPDVQATADYIGNPSGCQIGQQTHCTSGDLVTITLRVNKPQQACDRYYWSGPAMYLPNATAVNGGTYVVTTEPKLTISVPIFYDQIATPDFYVFAENVNGRSRTVKRSFTVDPLPCPGEAPAWIRIAYEGATSHCSATGGPCLRGEVVRFTAEVPAEYQRPVCATAKWTGTKQVTGWTFEQQFAATGAYTVSVAYSGPSTRIGAEPRDQVTVRVADPSAGRRRAARP